jgi:hypothetical protein
LATIINDKPIDRNDLTIDPPPHTFLKSNFPVENGPKIKRKKLRSFDKTAIPYIESPIKKEPSSSLPELSTPSQYSVLAECIKTHDALVKLGKDMFEDKIKYTQSDLIETLENYYEGEKEDKSLKNKNKTLKKATNTLAALGGISSIYIASTLFAAGAPLSALALFFAGTATLTGAMFELSGVSNKYTQGLQIAGQGIGLIGSGALFFTGALKLPSALQVGVNLLSAAHHSVNGISSIYQKQAAEGQALTSALKGKIDIHRMNIEDGAKMLTFMAESYELNTANLVAALNNEIDIYKKLVSIQLSGRN